MKDWKYIIIIIAVAIFLYGGFKIGRLTAPSAPPQIDTVTVIKTRTEYLPAHTSESHLKWQPLPRIVFYTDTLTIKDTIPIVVKDTVYIPITQKYYERLDGRLRLWVSGYQPQLDKWELDEQTKVVNYHKKWSFSVGVGPAIIYSPFHNNVDAGVGIFGGFTYTF